MQALRQRLFAYVASRLMLSIISVLSEFLLKALFDHFAQCATSDAVPVLHR